MYINNLTNLLAAQTNVAWLKEVTESTLSKEFMIKHQLTGSPKLSKQLNKLGMNQDYISLLLGSVTKIKLNYKHWVMDQPEIIVRLQGNSTHWTSCQAVNDPADLNCWKGSNYCVIKDDLPHYESGELMFITFGKNVLEDKEGWVSRAKLRKIYSPSGEQHLYLDRVYGNTHEVIQAATEIAAKQSCNLYMNNFIDLPNAKLRGWTMPSSQSGYQDSKSWNTSSIQIGNNANTLLKKAYVGRTQSTASVYTAPLSSVQYNPYKDEFKFVLEVVRDQARNTKKNPYFKDVLNIIDAKWSDVTELPEFYDGKEYHNKVAIGDYSVISQDTDLWLYFTKAKGSLTFTANDKDRTPEMYVYLDLPKEGYAEAEVPSNLKCRRSGNGKVYTVIHDCFEYGWAKAIDIEGYWKVTYESSYKEGEYGDIEEEYEDILKRDIPYRVVKLDAPDYGFAVAISLDKAKRRGDFDGN